LRRTAEVLTLASILLLTPLQALAQGYGGPSLLSRGGNSPGKRGTAPVDFTYYAGLRGTYESGLIAPSLDESGNLRGSNLYGGQVEVGAYGAKNSRRSSLGLDYRGDYRKSNSKISTFNGLNQALSLDFTFRPTRRVDIFAQETGGTTNRAFGGFSAPSFPGQQNLGVPLNEVYDSRVYFSQTTGGVGYRTSARTQFVVSGTGFIIKRKNRALIGMQGYEASGGVSHRLSRSDTIGVRYIFIHFEYPRIYGGSDIHMVEIEYERRLSRRWGIKLIGGAFAANTVGTQSVTLSPEVALILGRSTGVEAFDRTEVTPRIDATIDYTLQRSRWSAAYRSGVNPGNGFYITSSQQSANTGYSYTGIRKLSLGLSAGYTRYKSLGLVLRDLSTLQGGGGVNYRIMEHVDLSLQADRRRFRAPGVSGRSGTSIIFGLTYTPAHIPLSIW
jgi:hypothetical protein